MKIYDIEFKDELNVTKAEAKHIHYEGLYVIGLFDSKWNCLSISNYRLKFVNEYKPHNLIAENNYKGYKWIITNKLKQGDVVKSIYLRNKKIYVFDKKYDDVRVRWYIENNRPCSEWTTEKYMYKLVERE